MRDADAQVARVLRPEGRFVVLLHHWAVPDKADPSVWSAALAEALRSHGLDDTHTASTKFRSGPGLEMVTVRAGRG